jgi:hypothetical protein
MLSYALKDRGIDHCGTVRQGRKHMPRELHANNLRLRKGEDPVFFKCAETDIVACGWHDTKYVTFVSSVHTDNIIDKQMRCAEKNKTRPLAGPGGDADEIGF